MCNETATHRVNAHDAADPNAALSIQNYCNQVINAFNRANNLQLKLPFDMQPTIWFNPDLKSSYFFVPGILALLLVMISALLTSITITREKEMGTMEQILVSPVRPHENHHRESDSISCWRFSMLC
ncbi:MAG: ABC transporter permease [Calditrichia bacterium]